jgi:hypothetical protein
MKRYSNITRIYRTLLLIMPVIACAPEPTTPSDEDLGGVWTANAHLYTLSNFRMEILQEPEGIVSGDWFATRDGSAGGCPLAAPCDATGELIGRNTVSQVEIELIGAGRFEGVLIETNRLRGIFAVGESYDTITFNRTGTAVSADRRVKE